MALEIVINTSKVGIPFPKAYSRIREFRGNKTKTIYLVETFANATAAATLGVEPVARASFELDTEVATANGLSGLYADLKGRTGFTSSRDV